MCVCAVFPPKGGRGAQHPPPPPFLPQDSSISNIAMYVPRQNSFKVLNPPPPLSFKSWGKHWCSIIKPTTKSLLQRLVGLARSQVMIISTACGCLTVATRKMEGGGEVNMPNQSDTKTLQMTGFPKVYIMLVINIYLPLYISKGNEHIYGAMMCSSHHTHHSHAIDRVAQTGTAGPSHSGHLSRVGRVARRVVLRVRIWTDPASFTHHPLSHPRRQL